jgi:uridine phosphorylase
MNPIPATHLLVNPDGSIYHLCLKQGDVADHVIVVGDPGRVPEISALFDHVELKKANREFVTHTGTYRGRRVTAMSTGIGIDNIDIVMNELDALVNTDLVTRVPNPVTKRLNIIRIGTSGAIQQDVPLNAFAVASIAMGMDTMLRYYGGFSMVTEDAIAKEFMEQTDWLKSLPEPYFVKGTERWISKFGGEAIAGITATAPGFYGPQGRSVRLKLADDRLIEKLQVFSHAGLRILNFEMEAAALYAMGAMLGHDVLTVCAIIANRAQNTYNPDHKNVMNRLNRMVLDKIAED